MLLWRLSRVSWCLTFKSSHFCNSIENQVSLDETRSYYITPWMRSPGARSPNELHWSNDIDRHLQITVISWSRHIRVGLSLMWLAVKNNPKFQYFNHGNMIYSTFHELYTRLTGYGLLCFVVLWHRPIYSNLSGVLYWFWDNYTIGPVPMIIKRSDQLISYMVPLSAEYIPRAKHNLVCICRRYTVLVYPCFADALPNQLRLYRTYDHTHFNGYISLQTRDTGHCDWSVWIGISFNIPVQTDQSQRWWLRQWGQCWALGL